MPHFDSSRLILRMSLSSRVRILTSPCIRTVLSARPRICTLYSGRLRCLATAAPIADLKLDPPAPGTVKEYVSHVSAPRRSSLSRATILSQNTLHMLKTLMSNLLTDGVGIALLRRGRGQTLWQRVACEGSLEQGVVFSEGFTFTRHAPLVLPTLRFRLASDIGFCFHCWPLLCFRHLLYISSTVLRRLPSNVRSQLGQSSMASCAWEGSNVSRLGSTF
jgi:hypothetical protein